MYFILGFCTSYCICLLKVIKYRQIDHSGRAMLNSLVEREVKAPASEVGHEGEIWLV